MCVLVHMVFVSGPGWEFHGGHDGHGRPVKRQKSSYGHSGLCAPGPVSVVFSSPELQPPECTAVTHSNFSEIVVHAGGSHHHEDLT